MQQNKIPIYFVDWCLFTALGMEDYIGNLHFICATDTFDGLHPNIFVPPSFEYNHSLTSEQTLNALLAHPEVADYIQKHGQGKLLTWLFNEETEQLATSLGLELCLPPFHLRQHWDNKANTNRLAEIAEVPCVPYILSPIKDYAHLREISVHLGENLVIQMPHGMSGATTFFISTEDDFQKYHSYLVNGEEMKIMKRIRCRGASLEACVTHKGVVVSPLIVELIGIPELTIYQGGWCGDEFLPNAFPDYIIQQAQDYTIKMGEQLRKVGYKGYFEPDFLIDEEDGTLYLGEINMRFSGFTPLINNANIAQQDIPLLLLHLAEWLDIDYELDIEELNKRWTQQENLSPLSFLHLKNVKETLAKPIPTGIYQMNAEGKIIFVRSAISPQALENENEIFWFSSSGKESKIEKGDEVGGLFIRSAVTEDGKNLSKQAKAWIKGLYSL